MNFPGRRVYPNEGARDMSPLRDAGTVTKHEPTGFARGATTADYNIFLRGVHQRVDKKPERPYP